MLVKRQIINSCCQSLALLAFVSALLAHLIEKDISAEESLAKRRNIISCGGASVVPNTAIQSQLSTLRNYPAVQILSNHPTGYGGKGDKNSCPHQLTQSALLISSDRKYKSGSCGRQYHA